MKTGYESNAHTARDMRGVARCFRSWLSVSRGLLCVFLTVCLAVVPFNVHSNNQFMTIEKSEANANPAVVAGAGAAIAALAAELGISETALVLGICAVGAAGTGLAFYNASRTDVASPGFRPWDDLTPQEKQDWVGQDGTSKDYYDQQIAYWALQYGLLELDENGNPQPSPEPENDPNGHSRWQKARNVMIALAAGGASVALNDALAPFVDNAAATLKDFLFGDGANGAPPLSVSYQANYSVGQADLPVSFVTASGGSTLYSTGQYQRTFTFTYDQWFEMNNGLINGNPCYWLRVPWPVDPVSTDSWSRYEVLPMSLVSSNNLSIWQLSCRYGYYTFGYGSVPPDDPYVPVVNNWWVNGSASNGSYLIPNDGSEQWYRVLNANYFGTYDFGSCQYANGLMTGSDYQLNSVSYGQMYDTPAGLANSILDPTAYANWINSYSNPEEGYKRAVTVPSGFGDGNFTPTYSSFVGSVPEGNVTVIPDTQPLPSPNPTPNDPFNDVDFQQDFGDTVGELLSRPFSQLFPFCLINDLNVLTDKIEDAIYPSSGGMSVQAVEPVNGTAVLVIPLSDFGIPDVDDMTFDLSTLVQFGHMIRPWTTTLFILALLIGSFRFFLNRGGE